jgi:uncharacterized protein YidB (DUF937 family)
MQSKIQVRKKLPPKQEARKSVPINRQYEEKAKALLRYAMAQKRVSTGDLSKRLGDMGIEISVGGLANKISHGGFGSAFLLQCMEALDTNLVALPR